MNKAHGRFNIPDIQGKLIKMFQQPVPCLACGEVTVPQNNLRIECICGALWTFTLGADHSGMPHVVMMERWR